MLLRILHTICVNFTMEEKMKKILFTTLALGTMILGSISTSLATPVFFEINAGGWGYETAWAINQLTGGSWLAGMATGTMASYTNYTYNWDLGGGDYLLSMTDTFGDGLDGGGHAVLTVGTNTLLN